MQKINHHILYSKDTHGQRSGLSLREQKYLGFAMMVSTDTKLLGTDSKCIVFQLWQGSPHGPPLAGYLRRDSEGMYLSVQIADTRANRYISNPSAPRQEVGRVRLVQGKWYSFVLSVYPNTSPLAVVCPDTSTGWSTPPSETLAFHYKIQGGHSYKKVVSYAGPWGYLPGCGCIYAGNCDKPGPNPTLDFKIGPYRKAENARIKVVFDNLKMITEFETALPEYRCDKLA